MRLCEQPSSEKHAFSLSANQSIALLPLHFLTYRDEEAACGTTRFVLLPFLQPTLHPLRSARCAQTAGHSASQTLPGTWASVTPLQDVCSHCSNEPGCPQHCSVQLSSLEAHNDQSFPCFWSHGKNCPHAGSPPCDTDRTPPFPLAQELLPFPSCLFSLSFMEFSQNLPEFGK